MTGGSLWRMVLCMRTCQANCPLCYSNVRGRSAYKGHRGYHGRVAAKETVSQMLKKRTGGVSGGAPVNPLFVNEELAGYDSLAEFLLQTEWPEGGGVRTTGTVLIFMDSGGLKAMLNDRDQSLVAFVTIEPSEGILQALTHAVESTTTDWRAAKRFGGGKKS